MHWVLIGGKLEVGGSEMAEQMTIEVPEPIAAELRAAVDAGKYASTGDVIRDALRLWSALQRGESEEQARLRDAWDKGKASGRYGPIDFDGLRREARQRLASVEGHAD